MTKKHFIAIAGILADIPNLDDREIALTSKEIEIAQSVKTIIAKDLADYFKTDNDLFDRERFLTACKV